MITDVAKQHLKEELELFELYGQQGIFLKLLPVFIWQIIESDSMQMLEKDLKQ